MFINTHVGRFVGCESQPVALMAGGIASLKSLIQSYTAGVLCEGVPACVSPWPFFLWDEEEMTKTSKLDALRAATSREDLAKILDVKLVFLTNVLYRIGSDNQYTQFTIPKKGKGVRTISAPTDRLKDIQRRICDLLSDCRDEIFAIRKISNNYSFGFERGKSIILNAYKHRGKQIILNIDLKDFFESFNFGRVRGYFLSNQDFLLNPVVATTLAKAACYNGTLPQGSPCSPIISNLICNIMDMRLAKLAKKYGCTYSRYADDITISTNKNTFPLEMATVQPEGVVLGKSFGKRNRKLWIRNK